MPTCWASRRGSARRMVTPPRQRAVTERVDLLATPVRPDVIAAAAVRAGHSVELESITHRFGATTAVDGVRAAIEAGEVVALLGPSRLRQDHAAAHHRRLRPPGRRPRAGRRHARSTTCRANRRNIGIVFQNYALFPHMTVAENVAYGLRRAAARAATIATRVARMLDMVQLGALPRAPAAPALGRPAAARGAGPRARRRAVASCCSTSRSPRSTGTCGSTCRSRSSACSAQLGLTTILVTHDQDEAMSVADRIAVMNSGPGRAVRHARSRSTTGRSTLFVNGFIGTDQPAAGQGRRRRGRHRDRRRSRPAPAAAWPAPTATAAAAARVRALGPARAAARCRAAPGARQLADRAPASACRSARRLVHEARTGRRRGAQDRRAAEPGRARRGAAARSTAASSPTPGRSLFPRRPPSRRPLRRLDHAIDCSRRRALLAGAAVLGDRLAPAAPRPRGRQRRRRRPIPAPGRTPTAPWCAGAEEEATTSTLELRAAVRHGPGRARSRPRAARRRSTSSCSIRARASSAIEGGLFEKFDAAKLQELAQAPDRASPTNGAWRSPRRSWASPTTRRRCRPKGWKDLFEDPWVSARLGLTGFRTTFGTSSLIEISKQFGGSLTNVDPAFGRAEEGAAQDRRGRPAGGDARPVPAGPDAT